MDSLGFSLFFSISYRSITFFSAGEYCHQLLVDVVYNNLVVIVAIDSLLLDSLALFHHLSVHQLLCCFVSVKKCQFLTLAASSCNGPMSVCLSVHGKSIVLSAKLVDGRACWPHDGRRRAVARYGHYVGLLHVHRP